MCYGDIEISHPPTFEHFQQSSAFSNDETYTEEEFDYEERLRKAFQYTQQDIQLLLQQQNIDYVIGVAYQADLLTAIQMLTDHLPDVKQNKIALSLLVIYILELDPFENNGDLEQLTDQLIRLDKKNSSPYYLKAYCYMKLSKPDLGYQYVHQGNTCSHFNNYYQELSQLSIHTSEFLGYNSFAARCHALHQHDWLIYKKLTDALLKESPSKNTILQCRLLSEQLQEHSRTCMFDLLAYWIQRKAWEQLHTKQAREELQTVQKERKAINSLLRLFRKVAAIYDIPEQRWIQYYDELYGVSEQHAIRRLIEEYPVNIQKEVK